MVCTNCGSEMAAGAVACPACGALTNGVQNANYSNAPALKLKANYSLVKYIFLGIITLGIGGIVWYHNLSDRVGNELKRRGIPIEFGASTYWLWNVLGSLIVVGPFVYMAKLLSAMNALCEDYNVKG